MKRATPLKFGQLSSYQYGVDLYDPDKVGLGPRITQKYLSSSPDDGFVGPFPVAIARPMEQSTQIPGTFPWALQWSSTKDWVFLADNAATAATRRIIMYEYDRTTQAFTWKGFVTLTYPAATNHTIRGFRMTYDKYTTGTVAVSGTAVTGTTTAWSASRIAVGSRIGFGSTDPTLITTWYEISAIGSDTGITLTTTAGTITSGTPYVIEELRAITLNTNATTTNGGLFVAKGLRPEIFTTVGTTIPAATTVDNIRACYWLADASTVTNITAIGCGIQPRDSYTQHFLWGIDGTSTVTLFKHNLRAALTLTAGKDTTSLALKSGTTAALSGTATQLNNGRIATASHGPGSGLQCIYFTTGTRIYRTNDVSTITAAQTTFIADNSVETPPGSVNTFAASSLLSSIEYSLSTDRFFVPVNATTTPFRSYFTQYRTDGGQWDRIWGCDTRQIDQSAADSSTTPHPSMTGAAYSVWAEGGILYIATLGTTAILNRLYACPVADWEHTSNDYVLTPRLSCPNIDKFSQAWFTEISNIGGGTGKNLGMSTEPFRTEYRTTGITDDTGSWTLLNNCGIMMGVAGAPYIQFRLSFRTLGPLMIPARIACGGVIYDDLSTDDHWQPSVGESDVATPMFAWRFVTAYSGTVPALKVRLYDAVTGSLLLTDTTVGSPATWQKSTDGGTVWGSYNTTDKGNETTYIRYTPASIGSNIRVRALLTAA